MKLVIEQIDGNFFCDVVLSAEEIDKINDGQMVEEALNFQRRKWHIGCRREGIWDVEEDEQ